VVQVIEDDVDLCNKVTANKGIHFHRVSSFNIRYQYL